MSTESARFLELLECRLALLGSLAEALSAARLDVVSLDITGLEERVREQERLCREIRTLDSELDRVQKQCGARVAAGSNRASAGGDAETPEAQRCRETIERLARVQSKVKQLNQEHQALLRRSRRTVNALLNSYHSFAMTYANPAEERVAVGERA